MSITPAIASNWRFVVEHELVTHIERLRLLPHYFAATYFAPTLKRLSPDLQRAIEQRAEFYTDRCVRKHLEQPMAAKAIEGEVCRMMWADMDMIAANARTKRRSNRST